MAPVQQLYELWAGDSALRDELRQSLEPRGVDWLFEAAGLAGEIEVVEGAIEALPLEDASVDFVWCRDVLGHVDAQRGLRECARVLRPGGGMVAYVTVATPRLEPAEATELVDAMSLVPASLDADALRQAAAGAGLALVAEEELGSEWREHMVEHGDWDAAADLLSIARLRRQEEELAARYGSAAVAAAAGGLLWGVYQLLGKLRPTVFVWSRDA